jgi:RNA-splicing ligase RtcB
MSKIYIKQALTDLDISQSSLYRIMGKLGIKPKKEGKKSYLTDSQTKKLKEHFNSPTHDRKDGKDIEIELLKRLLQSKNEELEKVREEKDSLLMWKGRAVTLEEQNKKLLELPPKQKEEKKGFFARIFGK